RQLFQYGSRRQSGRVNPQPVLHCDEQAVSEEGDQHMRIRSVFQLVMDGPDAQFALQGAKHTLDLCQLYVARTTTPTDLLITAQQIMTIAFAGRPSAWPCPPETRRFRG